MPRVSNNMPEAYVQERPGTGPLLQLIGANTTDKLMQVVDSAGSEAASITAAGAISAKQITSLAASGSQTFSGALVGQTRNVLSANTLGATIGLTAAQADSLILFDRAAGCVVTLPTPVVGMEFDFYVTVTDTSNTYKVITNNTGTQFLMGTIINIDTDTSNAVAAFIGNGTTHVSVIQDFASTHATGGFLGGWLRFTAVSTTLWSVQGHVQAGGTPATSFSTS